MIESIPVWDGSTDRPFVLVVGDEANALKKSELGDFPVISKIYSMAQRNLLDVVFESAGIHAVYCESLRRVEEASCDLWIINQGKCVSFRANQCLPKHDSCMNECRYSSNTFRNFGIWGLEPTRVLQTLLGTEKECPTGSSTFLFSGGNFI